MPTTKPNTPPAPAASDLPGGLAAPAQRALAGAGISSLKQLSKFSEAEVKALHGIGPNALEKLRGALAAKGLSFAANTPDADGHPHRGRDQNAGARRAG